MTFEAIWRGSTFYHSVLKFLANFASGNLIVWLLLGCVRFIYSARQDLITTFLHPNCIQYCPKIFHLRILSVWSSHTSPDWSWETTSGNLDLVIEAVYVFYHFTTLDLSTLCSMSVLVSKSTVFPQASKCLWFVLQCNAVDSISLSMWTVVYNRLWYNLAHWPTHPTATWSLNTISCGIILYKAGK